MKHGRVDEIWARIRYEQLLPLAMRRRGLAAAYARSVATVEWLVDRRRRTTASERIARWLAVDEQSAQSLFRKCLASEALEEADTGWLMQHMDQLDRLYRAPDSSLDTRPAIWTTLHLGSPILAYLYLCRRLGIDARIIGRSLDAANPMPSPKQEWGRRKVRWVEQATGHLFFGADAQSIAAAREHLIGGGSIFAAIDVPGDVVGRSAVVEMFGERLRIAAGIPRLAEMTGASLRPLIAVSTGSRIQLLSGPDIETTSYESRLTAIGAHIEQRVRDAPHEWWLWPYLPCANR